MKRSISLTAFILLMLTFAFSSSAQQNTTTNSNQTKTVAFMQTKFTVSSQCEMCKATIEKALKNVKGVKRAVLNLSKNEVTVYYIPSLTNEETLKKAVTAVGYDAGEMKSDPLAYEKLHPCCKKPSE